MSGARFVVVEGNQGTGKSTVARHLAGSLGAALYHFPPGFSELRARLELDTAMPPIPRLAFYLAATLQLSELVEGDLASGRSVVCDRYLAAPLSLLLAEGTLTEASAEPFVAPVLARVRRPEMTLLMVSDHEIAAGRVTERAAALGRALTAVEERTAGSAAFFAAREEALRRYSAALGPVVEIDTTTLPPADVLAHADRALGAS